MILVFMVNVFMIRVNFSFKEKRNIMNINIEFLWFCVICIICDFFNCVIVGMFDELEIYFSMVISFI